MTLRPIGQMMNLVNGTAISVDLELAVATELQGEWRWVAPGKHLIPRGGNGSRDSCEIFGARQPFVKGDEIWIYYVGGDGPFHGYRTNQLMLAKIQRDGFAGYRASSPSCAAARCSWASAAPDAPRSCAWPPPCGR